ncbi:MAG: PAS domain S-box protein [Atribacterota bacterium]
MAKKEVKVNSPYKNPELAQKYLKVIDMILLTVDTNGIVTYINNKGRQILGYKKEREITGKNWFNNFVPKGIRNNLKKTFEKSLSYKVNLIKYFEYPILSKSGKKRIIGWRNSFLKDENNNITGFLSSGIDITERKKIQKELREEKKQMDTILSTLNTGLSIVNKDMKIEWVNKKTREMFPEHEPIGKKCYKFYEKRNTPCESCAARLVFKRGKIKEIDRYNTSNKRWYHIMSQPINDEKGEVVSVLESITDITDRKETERACWESESKYSSLVNRAVDGVSIVQDGVIKFTNPGAEKIIGYKTKDLIGMPIKNLLHPDDKKRVLEMYKGRMEGKNLPSRYEAKFIKKNGKVMDVEISGALIEYQGRPADMVIVRDITQRKRTQEELIQANKLASIGRLAAGVAHQINNPLSALYAEVQWLIERSKKDSELTNSLEFIEDVTERISKIISNLLTFSRDVSDGKLDFYNVNSIIKSCIKLLERRFSKSNIKVEKSLQEDLPNIKINKGGLEQVFLNILHNSVDAMTEGGKIEIITRKETKRDFIEIVIKDTGKGIPEKNLSEIFDPFFSTKPSNIGTGLGLSVVHGIIKRFGGNVGARSTVNKGTEISISLPIDKERKR